MALLTFPDAVNPELLWLASLTPAQREAVFAYLKARRAVRS